MIPMPHLIPNIVKIVVIGTASDKKMGNISSEQER